MKRFCWVEFNKKTLLSQDYSESFVVELSIDWKNFLIFAKCKMYDLNICKRKKKSKKAKNKGGDGKTTKKLK